MIFHFNLSVSVMLPMPYYVSYNKETGDYINYNYFNDNALLINDKDCVENFYLKIHYKNKYSIV